jgi:hypothetical protein
VYVRERFDHERDGGLADADDAAKGTGFTVTFEGLTLLIKTSGGGSRARTIDGTLKLTRQAAAAGGAPSYAIARDLTVQFADRTASGDVAQGTYVTHTLSTYVPDANVDPNDPFAAGTLEPSGTTEVMLTVNGEKQTRTITSSADTVLHWSRSCLREEGGIGFDAGTLVLSDDKNNVIRVRFSGCVKPAFD